ncbi:[LysW]-aminoadipate kinase [Pseudosporangium ferrugineum]|uniref:N-acetylglutamate kinase n=1 Tax=Pseudosporangium ferrugineum TaxID=439699 RepID=A0A2T0RLM8_9ACTN|nr:[LysW]-aminoadipate kinase [Pseudosporangium ferrugineum]PRY22041.1 N-acetylglutamate kinase [Pseudosporangium ferrugineum]
MLVVKCGGNAAVDPAAVCREVAAVARAGREVVLVHGGSGDIERLGARLGVPQRTQISPDRVRARHTDDATLELVTMALTGVVNPRLVAALQAYGVNAVGLSGLDGGLLRARRKAPQRAVVDGRRVLVRGNRAGTVDRVDAGLLRLLLHRGLLPVVSPPALADDGSPVNVNADRAAAAIAGALPGAELVLLTGAPGLLRDPADEDSVLAECAVAPDGPPPGYAHGGMALKLVAAREALRAGVGRVRIADGRDAARVRAALAGAGTAVVLGAPADRGAAA